MSIISIIPGTGQSIIIGILSTNTLQAAARARQNGTATNVFSSDSQASSLTFSQSYTNNGGAVAIAFSCISDTTVGTSATLNANFTRTSDAQVFPFNVVANSSRSQRKNAPVATIFGGTNAGTGPGTINITANIGGNNILSHAASIISIDDVTSFGNIITSVAEDRATVPMTATGVHAEPFALSSCCPSSSLFQPFSLP